MTANSLNDYLKRVAAELRKDDLPPKTLAEWQERRTKLRMKMFEAIGIAADEPATPLQPQLMGKLDRDGYSIEKIVFQSRIGVHVTANAYVPKLKEAEKAPAVLVVHGHWAGARRDPVVQSRCIGLAKLGIIAFAVDAFGAGERHPKPAKGTYHGALMGATLWPAGVSLLGMQVYDNRRAVDYLLSRPDVNGKLGITGASGGGNQSMNAGALDERIQAVVPVCSVGNYQAYFHTACCVCEVLPNALQFTEEGDVLGLVAPRALMVISATRDAIQFSPKEATKSVFRAKAIFEVHQALENLRHIHIESGHDYNQPMREAMYGWMSKHLKGQGTGEPIPEPAHTLETWEDLACYPTPDARPKNFSFPPSYAASLAKTFIEKVEKLKPTHFEEWEATALTQRKQFRDKLRVHDADATVQLKIEEDGKAELQIAEELRLPAFLETTAPTTQPMLIIGMEGLETLKKHPRLSALSKNATSRLYLELRGTGATKYKSDAVAGAPDHNSAEHAVFLGMPMLGQWIQDVWYAAEKWNSKHPITVVGIGAAGVVAGLAVALNSSLFAGATLIDSPVSLVTDQPYATGTPMGLLAPGVFQFGDVQHWLTLAIPRSIHFIGGLSPLGTKLNQAQLESQLSYLSKLYEICKVDARLTIEV
jgi:dienelactone hydrolase